MRDNVVNEDFNLNYTEKQINLIKFRAFKAFQDDYNQGVGMQLEQGIFPYLSDEFYSRSQYIQGCGMRRISRKTSGNIHREAKHSFEDMNTAFEGEQPLHGEMVEKLHDIKTAMRLSY